LNVLGMADEGKVVVDGDEVGLGNGGHRRFQGRLEGEGEQKGSQRVALPHTLGGGDRLRALGEADNAQVGWPAICPAYEG
jgi:hypothetical protein